MQCDAMKKLLIQLYNIVLPVFDPLKCARSVFAYPRWIFAWWRYAHLPDAEQLRIRDAYPQLHDCTGTTGVNDHYFYVNGWAMRRIVAQRPVEHVDIGSQTIFVNLLSAVIPVTFVDYRPLNANIEGLTNLGGDILNLSYANDSISSLSCLHVAEHIGLGRYGDPFNPNGTRLSCAELYRVLEPGGNLYFAVPVGRPRVCFNAHRIHAPKTIVDYFAGLELVEFSGVHDNGQFVERIGLDEFDKSEYACGMFWFRKKLPGRGSAS